MGLSVALTTFDPGYGVNSAPSLAGMSGAAQAMVQTVNRARRTRMHVVVLVCTVSLPKAED